MKRNNPGCITSILSLLGISPKTGLPDFPYRLRDDFLSPAEASFLHILKTLAGEKMLIYPQVSLAALFFVPRSDKNYQAFQNKIDRKRVDFLLCDPQTFKPLFAIELDDSSHTRPDRQERDEFVNEVFQAGGLPLVHVKAQATYNTQELATQFQSALHKKPIEQAPPASTEGKPPVCPKCGVPMVLRTARKGDNPGQQFYGCPNYPRCRVIFQLE